MAVEKSISSRFMKTLRVCGAEEELEARTSIECSLTWPVKLYWAAVSYVQVSRVRMQTHGICISNCSSASLSSSGSASNRSAHVFLTIAFPEWASDSLRVVMSSKLMGW